MLSYPVAKHIDAASKKRPTESEREKWGIESRHIDISEHGSIAFCKIEGGIFKQPRSELRP